MRKGFKVFMASMIALTMVVISISGTYAESKAKGNSNRNNNIQLLSNNQAKNVNLHNKIEISFKDIKKDFWAYDSIMTLVKLGVINGYPDNTFKPNESVTRSEFAVMLTKALDLTATGTTQTFADVPSTRWDFSVVEASKSYLTGYQKSNGTIYFYGERDSVREDMAVALVKALNLTILNNSGEMQQLFTDYNLISTNLRDFVYTAYKAGLMVGSDGKFSPQGKLTRAESAALLERALEKTNKIVVDSNGDIKIVIGGSGQAIHTDAALSNLLVNGATVTGFASNVLTYNVILAAGTTAVPAVTAAVNDTGKATAVITQAAGLPGSAFIVVTAQDGTIKKTYNINFTVAAPVKNTDARLSNLMINGIALTGFAPDVQTYNVILPIGTTIIPVVTVTVKDAGKATAVVTQAVGLPGIAAAVVTAQDETTKKTYTVNFIVAH